MTLCITQVNVDKHSLTINQSGCNESLTVSNNPQTLTLNIGQRGAQGASGGPTYDPATYVAQSELDAYYDAWERIDGTGYRAQRFDRATNTITESFGALPIPADLTTLTYS